MPPKKETGPSKKTINKALDKVVEDKTFGLKNKNKSKTVQKFIKGVETQVKKPNLKGGEGKLLADQAKMKEAEKKQLEKELLLNSLFRSVIAAGGEGRRIEPRVEEKIDLYTDQRELLAGGEDDEDSMANWSEDKLKEVVNEKESKEKSRNKTDKVCMHFLDAVEKRKYGWRWACPLGESCIYKHCLPPGYVLKGPDRAVAKEERTLEEVIEEERGKLGTTGTPVTLESFKKWREEKAKRKEIETEKKRQEEIKKNKGGKGFNVLSGRALFKYDPTLFADDEDAVENKEYEERDDDQEEEDGREERKEGDEDEDEEGDEEEEDGEEGEEKDGEEGEEEEGEEEQEGEIQVSKKNVKVNEDLFLDEEDVELPE